MIVFVRRWCVLCLGLLAACAPATNPKTAVPFQGGQQWEMIGTPSDGTRTRQFTFVLKTPKPRGEDISFDDDRVVTVQGVQYVMAGILYASSRDVAVATAIDLNTADGSFCLVRRTRSFPNGALEGRYFVGSVEEFIGYASKDDWGKFGRCRLNRRSALGSSGFSRPNPRLFQDVEHRQNQ
jgi:hypothetical protein